MNVHIFIMNHLTKKHKAYDIRLLITFHNQGNNICLLLLSLDVHSFNVISETKRVYAGNLNFDHIFSRALIFE